MATRAQYEVQYDAARALDRLVGIVQDPDPADVDWATVYYRAEALMEIARRGMHHTATNPDKIAELALYAKTGHNRESR